MKSKLSINAICLLAASAFALGLAPSSAAAHSGPCYPSGSQHMHGDQLPPHIKALNLSQDQKEKLQAIQAAHKEVLNQSREQMRANKAAERELVESPNFDEKKAESLAAQDAKIMETNALATLRFRHEIYQILTPEQRAKFNQMNIERHKSRQPQPGSRSSQ